MSCCDGFCDCHPNCFHLCVCVCVCVCVRVVGGPFRREGHFRAAVRPPQADGAGAATSHAVCVPVC